MKIYKNHIATPNSAESCLELITALAFDYDGETTVEGLKSLIDEISDLATKGLKFLHEGKINREFVRMEDDYTGEEA